MPITLALPPAGQPIEIGQAAFRASRLAQTLAMAYALHQRGEARPHWLNEAIKELNDISDLLRLELAPRDRDTDPVDVLFDRANVLALYGQVLR